MRRSFRLSSVFAGLALAAAGCGGDGPTETTGDPLAEAEVQELAGDIFAGMSGYFTGNFSAQRQSVLLPEGLSLNLMSPVPVSLTIDESGPCGGDGTATVNGSVDGTVDDQTGAGSLEFDITHGFTNCQVVGELHTYVVSGEPNIRLTGRFEFDGGQTFSGTFDLVGGFGFSVDDGRSGTCGVDVSASINVNGTSLTTTATGTVCGVSVNNTLVFGQ